MTPSPPLQSIPGNLDLAALTAAINDRIRRINTALTDLATPAATPDSGLVAYGTHALRLSRPLPAEGSIYFETDQNHLGYQVRAGVWALLMQTTGSFTPTLLFGGAAVGMTTSASVGAYCKVGNLVILNMVITLTAKGSSVGVATITGLPFAVGGGAASWGGTFGFIGGMTGLVNPIVRVSGGAPTTVLLSDGGTGNTTQLADTNFTNASNLSLSISYYV